MAHNVSFQTSIIHLAQQCQGLHPLRPLPACADTYTVAIGLLDYWICARPKKNCLHANVELRQPIAAALGLAFMRGVHRARGVPEGNQYGYNPERLRRNLGTLLVVRSLKHNTLAKVWWGICLKRSATVPRQGYREELRRHTGQARS